MEQTNKGSDQTVLEAFYQMTNGDSWDDNSGWANDLCLAFGITCDNNGYVTEM